MKLFDFGKFLCLAGGLAGTLALFNGCGDVNDEGGGPVDVYGDFGYTEPWVYGAPGYDERGVYVHPPYDHGRAAPDRGHPAPSGGAHPSGHAPSIPSAPRPSGGGSHGGGDRKR